ncbi:MAG: serine/threonine protein kinase [Deltaproteobacteria bacterium]|nr:serine/threonine protein kinase [Deltaproteobacteria bacterium]
MASAEDTVQRIGRYEIVRKIATGGMAELYLGRFTGPGGFEKRCALKRILPQFAADQTFQRMFQNEARVTAMFDHPNVVQVFELGQDDKGQFYIAMELVNGMNLRQLMQLARDTGQAIPPELAAFMMVQALDGLAYAHAFRDPDSGEPLHLVHRDISPQNILVSYEGAVKLVDFGIVKGSSISGETQAGMLKGKVAYMSPEQASGEPIDGRSDLFSIGVCFYELVAGHRPFQGANDIMTLKSILDDPPTPVTHYVPDLANGIEHAIHRALAKFPDQRYASARDFHLELQHVLRDCPTPLGRHVVADYIRALTEGDTVTFDATRLRIPRGARSVGFAFGREAPVLGSAPPPSSASWPPVAGAPPHLAPSAPPAAAGAALSYDAPPAAPALDHTPMPLDESLDGTSEMLRQAGLPQKSRHPLLWWGLFLVSAAVGALGVGWVLHNKAEEVVLVEPMPTSRLVEMDDPTPLPEAPQVDAPPADDPPPAVEPRAARVEPPPPTVRPDPNTRRRRRRTTTSAATEPSAPAAVTGHLSLSSIPAGLQVSLDGKALGTTPLEKDLPPGTHTLKVTSKPLGIRRSVVVTVTADGLSTERLQVGRGSLNVVSRPWAEVYVNGVHKGKTPITVPAYEGRQEVKLVAEDGQERIQVIHVKPDVEELIRVRF